jgi:hypothetical protein
MTEAGIRIKEGMSYNFTIGKHVLMPDGEKFISLKGPDGKKYLIPAERYGNYGLEQGSEVVCRIDKINCKGEVFIEPRHPYYSENKWYTFEVIEFREIEGSRIREGRVMVVRTVTGDQIPVPVPPEKKVPEAGLMVELLVVRISKGRVHLAMGKNNCSAHHLNSETVYEFKVEGIETDIDGEEYFVVTDQLGVVHTIRRSYYEYYGLRAGVIFSGKVVRYREDGTRMIEPLNPFYSPGQKIEIVISRNERNRTDGSWYIAGADRYGYQHELRVPVRIKGNRLMCRIVMIRKGKPLLEPEME